MSSCAMAADIGLQMVVVVESNSSCNTNQKHDDLPTRVVPAFNSHPQSVQHGSIVQLGASRKKRFHGHV